MCIVIKYTKLYTVELLYKFPFLVRNAVPVLLEKIAERDARLLTDRDMCTGLPVCETDLT